MTELNELFEQIFHEELKFKARTDKLKQLAESIEQGKIEIVRTREERATKQGELAVKSNKVAELEVELKLLSIRKGILQEQKDSLTQKKQDLTEKLAEKRKRSEEEHQDFKTKLIEFGRNYDLHGSGFKRRQEERKKKIDLLQDEEVLLKTELAEMDVQKEEVQRLEKELSEAEEVLEKEKIKSKELNKTLLEQEAEIERLTEECNSMSQKLSKDPEFIRLQKELESCKACPEEAELKAAKQQLKELQQQCYHHQMRQQLNRQKSSTQNKSVDSSRRPGHYNPYTCQYVPAPKPNSLVGESWGSRSIAYTQQQRGAQEKEPEEDIKLVDDEWLITGDEEMYLDDEDDNWDMESVRDDIEDDIILTDSDWSNFDSPGEDVTSSTWQQNHGASRFTDTAVMSIHMQRSNAQNIATSTSQLKHTLSKPTVAPQKSLLRESQVVRSQSSRVTNVSVTQGPAFQRLLNQRVVPSATPVMDSPQPGSVVRKRSGQSIYKAPGSKPSDASIPKKAKKVRFHH